MLALLTSPVAAQVAVIAVAALLGWIACLRAQVHRRWIRQPDRVEQLTALPSRWCIPLTTMLGSL